MAYTIVSKPTSPSYTAVNGVGKEQYDQSNLTYDGSTTFYDGANQALYTSVSKPTTTTYTSIAKPT